MGFLFFLSPGCAALVLLKDVPFVFCPLFELLMDCQITCYQQFVVDRIIIFTKKWQGFFFNQEVDRQLHTDSTHQVAGCKDYPSPL